MRRNDDHGATTQARGGSHSNPPTGQRCSPSLNANSSRKIRQRYSDAAELTFLSSGNFEAIVGFPRVKRLIDRSSALLFASRRLFAEPSKASFIFCR